MPQTLFTNISLNETIKICFNKLIVGATTNVFHEYLVSRIWLIFLWVFIHEVQLMAVTL